MKYFLLSFVSGKHREWKDVLCEWNLRKCGFTLFYFSCTYVLWIFPKIYLDDTKKATSWQDFCVSCVSKKRLSTKKPQETLVSIHDSFFLAKRYMYFRRITQWGTTHRHKSRQWWWSSLFKTSFMDAFIGKSVFRKGAFWGSGLRFVAH